ncbi:MAG: AbrB/MazE/SpoVT family DNA-binding domain-containing protein [Nanoarchaeota archaeon]
METRKIQLIAGTTYSISLPKDWVKRHNLKEKNELMLYEANDRSLIITPHHIATKKSNEINLNIDDYLNNIDQILFSVYYLGIENINLFSKKGISKDAEIKIRKTLANMSGTEITYEDKNNIKIKVFLDKSKIDILQVIYRIILIIESSITSLLGEFSIEEIRINENEIDRLYHLISKIISLSLTDAGILQSSNINYSSLITSYFLIGKKLENIADNINHISEHLNSSKGKFEHSKEILLGIKEEMDICATAIIGNKKNVFEKLSSEKIKRINSLISGIKDKVILNYAEDIIRYTIDIEEEIVIISFYNHLISQNIIN